MGKKKTFKVTTNVGDAASTFASEVESLASEMSEWRDNMPESKQSSDKYSEVDEAASTLENVSELDAPECCADLVVEFEVSASKKYKSRSTRLSEATRYASEAIEAVQGAIDNNNESKAYTEDQVSEMETFVQELQDIIDEMEGVEFPGMYG